MLPARTAMEPLTRFRSWPVFSGGMSACYVPISRSYLRRNSHEIGTLSPPKIKPPELPQIFPVFIVAYSTMTRKFKIARVNSTATTTGNGGIKVLLRFSSQSQNVSLNLRWSPTEGLKIDLHSNKLAPKGRGDVHFYLWCSLSADIILFSHFFFWW